MNFLRSTSVVCRRAVIAFLIISSLTFAAFAQKSPQEGCKNYGCPGFVGEPISLKVVNADIRDILNYITEQYGINFVVDSKAKTEPVTVNVTDVPWNLALDSILQAQDLAVQVNGTILRIADSSKITEENRARLALDEAKLNNASLYTEFIRLNYAFGSGSLSGQSGQAGAFSGGVTSSTVSNTVGSGGGNDQGILGIIKRRLSRRGSIEVDVRSNTLIVTDVRENIDAVRQLVALLDQPEPQVEIEARIVVATRNFSRDLGVQLSGLVLGSNGRAGSFATVPGSREATQNGGGGGGQQQNTTGFRPNGIPVGVGLEPNNSLLSSIPNTVIGLTTGIFGTAQISLLLTAGEQKNQAKIIATPRVTTLNNRPAQVESGVQIPIVTVQPNSASGAVVATTEYVNVPLRLAVTPQITDAGTVILNVVAENNTVGGGGAISTQRMQTQVMVPDGGTTVVGGALLDAEREEQDRTPGLSKIPLLGNLFKRKGTFRDATELLFFITPRIFRPDYNGNQLPGKVSDGNRTTTILQPVPLGNPESNSSPTPESTPQPQQVIVPVVPSIQPESNPTKKP